MKIEDKIWEEFKEQLSRIDFKKYSGGEMDIETVYDNIIGRFAEWCYESGWIYLKDHKWKLPVYDTKTKSPFQNVTFKNATTSELYSIFKSHEDKKTENT